MFNIGDEVIAIKGYDGNELIINKTGTIVDIFTNGVTIYFHEKINGHSGQINENYKLKLIEKLSKKYNTPLNNCWCISKIKLNDCIIKMNSKNKMKYDLFKIAKL